MAEDWAADVKKFVPDADDAVIAAIVRYCGIALHNRDSSLVSFTDPVETGRVRDNFLKKKLGLTQADEVLDQAIAAVGERMKGVNFKNRVTVYYLLLDHFGLHHLFGGKSGLSGGGTAGVGGLAAGAAALGVAGLGDGEAEKTAPLVAPVETPAFAAGAVPPPVPPPAPDFVSAGVESGGTAAYGALDEGETKGGGIPWWLWLLLALLALALIWWLFFRPPSGETGAPAGGNDMAAAPAAGTSEGSVTAISNASASANGTDIAAAPVEGTVAIPAGAGVTTEARDGKPVVKVYFDTGKTDIVPAFAPAAEGLKAYLASHAGTSLAVSGYNDKAGNAAANAELSKNRAQAVKAALVSAGIADASVALVKPEEATDTTTSNEAARRVEVVVK